jgi:hypothetical protein
LRKDLRKTLATTFWLLGNLGLGCSNLKDSNQLGPRQHVTLLMKDHVNRETTLAKQKSPYVAKWLSNEEINQKLSNHFWKNDKVPDTQITQTLKFRYAQYMGNHRKNIFWPLKYQNPNCTLCRTNDRDTWPHLLYTCEHPYLKGLRIARHNKAAHLIAQTLQANKNTRFFTLTNAGKLPNQP